MKLVEKSIIELLKEQIQKSPNAIALEYKDLRYTAEEVDFYSAGLAEYLNQRGITRGSHVGLWLANSPYWIFSFLAVRKLGATAILLNTYYQEQELRDVLQISDAKYLLYDDRTGKDASVIQALKDVGNPDCINIQEFSFRCFRSDEKTENWLSPAIRQDAGEVYEPSLMLFTSGSMGVPKGVFLSEYNVVNNAIAIAEAMHWTKEDRMCIAVPLFHCFGVTAGVIAAMACGLCIVISESSRTAVLLGCLERAKCTILNGVPSMFLALIKKQSKERLQNLSLTSGIIAGSMIGYEEYLHICEYFPHMHLQPSYGQTETSPCVTIAEYGADPAVKAGSAGKVVDHVEIRIRPMENALYCGEYPQGEIEVRGYNVMSQYYRHPSATKNAFTEDGWLKTGDMGYLDDEGYLHISGRLKELIIRCGENIAPAEIENVIREIEGIEAVKVIGIPSEIVQEEIVACIIIQKGYELSDQKIREYLRPRLAGYKIPAYILRFDAFPQTSNGKTELGRLGLAAQERVHKNMQEALNCTALQSAGGT